MKPPTKRDQADKTNRRKGDPDVVHVPQKSRLVLESMGLTRLQCPVKHFCPLGFGAMVHDCRHAGAELFKLAHPIGQGGEGTDNEKRAWNAVFVQVGKEPYGLHL